MYLEFLNDIYAFIFIPVGLIAVWMGIDRAFKEEDEESDVLQWIGGITGLVFIAITVILAYNEFSSPSDIITKYSILFSILLGLSLIARPFKKIPLAFVVSVFILLGIMYALIANQDEIASTGFLDLKIIIIIVLIIVGIVFVISFVQEQAMDGLLWILGWGPVITFFGLALIAQGITLIIEFPDSDGILSYLPG